MKIQFLGAAEGVTGSCYYIQTEDTTFLVDCGQFQGHKTEQKKNEVPFPFDPKSLDFIILTHGHIDHSGRVPKLVQLGFSGRIFMTRGTASLSELLLKDSAKIHEYETEHDNEKRKKAGLDAIEPYYTLNDAIDTLQYFNPVPYDTPVKHKNIALTFINAGHLLGSAHVHLTIEGKTFLFSGDIGSQHSQILVPPKPAVSADYIIMETTYGDRNHVDMDERFQNLYTIIKETVAQKGTVIIPAFSVGRTQDIIYGLNTLAKDENFKNIPFYVDSPMAIHATEIFTKDTEGMKPNLIKDLEAGQHPFDMVNLKFVDDAKSSYMLNFSKDPKVLISASGMCDAGRILHHLKAYLEKQKTNVIFVGYQSEESLGRQIQNLVTPLKIADAEVDNKAQIHSLHGFSGHADQSELITWLSEIKSPKKIFLVHGESNGLDAMRAKIKDIYGYTTYTPTLYEVIEL